MADKWEYYISQYTCDPANDARWEEERIEQLNALGAQGWEAVAAEISANGFAPTQVLFKRRLTVGEEMKKEVGL